MNELSRFVNVDAARAEFGETVYAYHKIPVVFCSGRRRGQEKHFTMAAVPCTKEEYEANYAEGCRCELERFVKGAAERLYESVQHAKDVLMKVSPTEATTNLAFDLIEAGSMFRQVRFAHAELKDGA